MSIKQDPPPENARIVAFIPVDGFVEGHGYRVSLVVEGESGHRPTGDWPFEAKPGQQLPWFWGNDYDEARKLASEYNQRMGIDEDTAAKIIAASMALDRNDDPPAEVDIRGGERGKYAERYKAGHSSPTDKKRE